jgi:hypothetical protein
VGDDPDVGPAVGRRLLLEGAGAEDVVDVAVGVHGRVEAGGVPLAHLGVDERGDERAAGVDEDQAVIGAEGRDVGERLEEGGALADLLELVGRGERVVVLDRDLAGDDAIGQVQEIGHST